MIVSVVCINNIIYNDTSVKYKLTLFHRLLRHPTSNCSNPPCTLGYCCLLYQRKHLCLSSIRNMIPAAKFHGTLFAHFYDPDGIELDFAEHVTNAGNGLGIRQQHDLRGNGEKVCDGVSHLHFHVTSSLHDPPRHNTPYP